MSITVGLFPGGVHPPQHKDESTTRPIAFLPVPPQLVVPLGQHIGAPSLPTVNIGDRILKGQRIAKPNGFVSVSQHAPTSGVVKDIGEYPVPHPSGFKTTCIVIDSDGRDEWAEAAPADSFDKMDPSHLRNLIRDAGIVGLGGAGFPTFIKLNPGPRNRIDTLIINGIECEPYITCDDLLMQERAKEVIAGIRIMRHALQAKNVIIAIEDNKSAAIAAMQEACTKTDYQVAVCPTAYPQGGEKQLIQVLTGKEVPANGLPSQIGIVVQNVATAAAIHHAVDLGRPLVSRVVTVTGNGVRGPGNFEVLVGTPMSRLLEHCHAFDDLEKLIVGGPMMGFALPNADAPVIKTTNCLLTYRPSKRPVAPTLPCIRCGACAEACPASLLPQQLYWASFAKDFDQAQEYNLFDCIECGCCSYVCPSQLPLVQYYRYAKGEIWRQEREKQKASVARQRHEFRLERIDREKLERAQKHAKKREDLTQTASENSTESDTKKAAILAAMARVKAKQATQPVTPQNTDNLSDEQKRLIAEADQRRAEGQDKP